MLFRSLKVYFRLKSRSYQDQRDSLIRQISSRIGQDEFIKLKDEYYNDNLANYVLNSLNATKIYDNGNRFIQKADPVFMKPGSKIGRAHFFAPYKQVASLKINTLLFNLFFIWMMNAFLFVALYYNLLKRLIRFLETLKLPIVRKYGRELLQF